VQRYRAGKAPEWAGAEQQAAIAELRIGDREVVRTDVAAPVIVRKADSRLARLQQVDVEEARERHREIRAAEIVRRRERSSSPDEEQERAASASEDARSPAQPHAGDDHEEDDEAAALKRRQAVRERWVSMQAGGKCAACCQAWLAHIATPPPTHTHTHTHTRRLLVQQRLEEERRQQEAAARQGSDEEEVGMSTDER
jgi:hypothetical protein